MQQTIKFLKVLDAKSKRRSLSSVINRSQNKDNKQSSYLTNVIKKQKFPYAKVLNFTENKFDQLPLYLTERQDFVQFMYQKYQKKLLTIPKICQKQKRASDQKYFISLYLQQIDIFKGLPSIIMDIILDNLKVKYYKINQVVHDINNQMQFMGIIFVGFVQLSQNGQKIIKSKNQIIMSQAFYKKNHPTIIAKQQTIILVLERSVYGIIQSKLLQDILQKSRDQVADLLKSDFFIELHLKDRKARAFFDVLLPQFYFKGETICQAGQEAMNFYLVFRGELIQQNHIYIRQHNKWPLPNKRWEVRAVYNSFEKEQRLKQFNFFGDEQIISMSCLKSSYVAKTHCILFSMNKTNFQKFLNNQDFKRLKKYRNQHININYYQFEKEMRERIRSQHDRKKIIHKAIDTSFANRNKFIGKKIDLIQSFQKQMVTKSVIDDQQEEKNIETIN